MHGFGANANYWRAIYPEMSKNYRVIGIDLLGYGESYKPMKKEKIHMSIDLWTQQVKEFIQHHVQGDYVVVGNSIGSLISVTMAAGQQEDSRMKGVYLVNCAEGMNYTHMIQKSKNILQSVTIALITQILKDDLIFKIVHSNIRTNVKKILKKQYFNPERVDDELVNAIVSPSLERGARWAFQST